MADEQDFLDDMFYQDLRQALILKQYLLQAQILKQYLLSDMELRPNQQPVWTNYDMAGTDNASIAPSVEGVIDLDKIPLHVTSLCITLPDGTDVGFIRRKPGR